MTGSGPILRGGIWSGHSRDKNQPPMKDYTTPDEIRATIDQVRADRAIETAILAARAACDLAIDVRADVPGLSGQVAAWLLNMASRLLYRYASQNPRHGGDL